MRIIPSRVRRWFMYRPAKTRRWIVRRFFDRSTILLRIKHGPLLLLDHDSFVDNRILLRNNFEDAQIAKLFGLAERAAVAVGKPFVFLDIGAYNALYALVAAQSSRAGKIVAFEPEAVNRAQLHAQLFLNNRVRRIEVFSYAASDTDGTVQLAHVEVAHGYNRGQSSLATRPAGDAFETVETRRLDSMFDLRDTLIVAKVDVEGHECAVIDGAKELLAGNACILQVESLPESGQRSALIQQLSALGYRQIGMLDHDLYFTNLPEGQIGA